MDRSEESVLFDTDESPGDNALSKVCEFLT